MKVNADNRPIQLEAYQKHVQTHRKEPVGPQAAPAAQTKKDVVELSDRAKEIQQAAESLSRMSDIREEKVQAVKKAVEKGTYKVAGAKVATDMLRDTFENNMLLTHIDTHA